MVNTSQENYAACGFAERPHGGLLLTQVDMASKGRSMRRFVVVYWSGSDWRWRTLTTEGRILKSSEEGYGERDGALEAAYRENPHTPVEVDVLFSATAGSPHRSPNPSTPDSLRD
jgi:uncharacterized protein YegP (UPF0339 family)